MNIKKITYIFLINNVMTKKLISNLSKLNYQPKTINQYEYNNALYDKLTDLVICTGPAGRKNIISLSICN